jgi:hypothetical protein
MIEATRSNELFQTLHKPARGWCDRRSWEALSLVLPAYLGFTGLSGAWRRLHEPLSNLRISARHESTEAKVDEVANLVDLARRIT